jgi:hypothetical protein
MFDQLNGYASALSAWQLCALAFGLCIALVLLRTRLGFSALIAAFVVSICYAPAADLRVSLPLVSLLPGVLAAFLCSHLLLVHARPLSRHVLAIVWITLMSSFALRALFSAVGTATLYWNGYYLIVLLLGLSLGGLLRARRFRTLIARALMLGSLIALSLGFAAIVLQANIRAFTQDRFTPWGIQANIWGPTSLVAVLNTSLFLRLNGSRGWRSWKLAVLVLPLISLFLSFSRGSLVALGAGVMVYLIVAGRERLKTTLVVLFATTALAGIVAWAGANGMLELEAADRLLTMRSESRETLMLDLYHDYVVREPIFGIGFFQKQGSPEIGRGDPHNSLLLVWIEQGTVGLLLIVALITVTIGIVLRVQRRVPPDSVHRLLANHALFSLAADLVVGQTVPHLWTHHAVLGFDFALRAGLAAGLVVRSPHVSSRRLAEIVGRSTKTEPVRSRRHARRWTVGVPQPALRPVAQEGVSHTIGGAAWRHDEEAS